MTIKNKKHFPSIDDLFDKIKGASYFSNIELWFSYHQLRMKEDEILKNALRIRYSHYKFFVMSFGLNNTPDAFMD